MLGESFGQAKHSERIFRKEEEVLPGHSASKRLFGEREFIAEAAGAVKIEVEKNLRKKIAEIEERIASIAASIEKLVSSIQAGEKIVRENAKNEMLGGLHAKLRGEADQEKLALLEEKTELEEEKAKLEEELMSL